MNGLSRASAASISPKNHLPLTNELPTPTPYSTAVGHVAGLVAEQRAVLRAHLLGRALQEQDARSIKSFEPAFSALPEQPMNAGRGRQGSDMLLHDLRHHVDKVRQV